MPAASGSCGTPCHSGTKATAPSGSGGRTHIRMRAHSQLSSEPPYNLTPARLAVGLAPARLGRRSWPPRSTNLRHATLTPHVCA